jgi:hypothetical protein
MMELSSGGIFALAHPDHVLTGLFRQIAGALVS